MRYIIVLFSFFTLFFENAANSQRPITREDISYSHPRLPIKAFVIINGHRVKDIISNADLARYDLQIELSDTSYKIIGFIVSRECPQCSLIDLRVETYLGNRIKAADKFLKNLEVGTFITFEGISIRKDEKTYNAIPLLFKIQ